MKKLWMPVVILFVMITGIPVATAQKPADRPVLRLDPALDALVSPDAKLELVKSGFGFTEGALWVRKARAAICCLAICPPT